MAATNATGPLPHPSYDLAIKTSRNRSNHGTSSRLPCFVHSSAGISYPDTARGCGARPWGKWASLGCPGCGSERAWAPALLARSVAEAERAGPNRGAGVDSRQGGSSTGQRRQGRPAAEGEPSELTLLCHVRARRLRRVLLGVELEWQYDEVEHDEHGDRLVR